MPPEFNNNNENSKVPYLHWNTVKKGTWTARQQSAAAVVVVVVETCGGGQYLTGLPCRL